MEGDQDPGALATEKITPSKPDSKTDKTKNLIHK